MNRLAKEQSAYLRHSAHQKIDWYPWSDEAFERAKREGKPVFLSTGAAWCHWCHVMAKECFENGEIAALMNELFINIKLDRDERPDIDRRYQQAVAAMGGGSGWPLSAFLTPEGEPFFGGTYFPPEDGGGRPGFKNVLRAVKNYYTLKKEEAGNYARRVMEALRPEMLTPGEITRSFVDDAVTSLLSRFDPQHGGFGTAPKFPMPGATEFLIHRYAMTQNQSIGSAVRKTLEAMARGGFHDQIGGGFHRYCVDEAWVVPHFEKMADDNAWLLRNYIDAYTVFEDERFKETALGIISFTRGVLSDPAGGFSASQDADVTPDDEGGYFTWTDADFKKVLSGEEYDVLSLHLFHERGAMHHDPSKKVLCAAVEPHEIAERLGMEKEKVIDIIRRGKGKLLRERNTRQSPLVDRTLYTSLNGMLISSYLRAFRVLRDPWLKEFGLKSLDRVLKDRLVRVGTKHASSPQVLHSEGVPAVLDDYVHLIEALVSAYEVTAKQRYLAQADELMELCIHKFGDTAHGGFFDTEAEVLGARLKRVEDIPHPSANSTAVMLLLKLSLVTGKEHYRRMAEASLRIFAESAGELGVHAGSYFCALDAYFTMLKFAVETAPSSDLAGAVLSLVGPYAAIVHGTDQGRVIPCRENACFEPVHTTEGLMNFLMKLQS